MKLEIKIPAVGESITEATIAEWHKNSGDFVKRDEILLSLETDKATVEVVAEQDGKLEQTIASGETVQIGSVVGNIDTESKAAETPPPTPAATEAPKQEETPSTPKTTAAETPPSPPATNNAITSSEKFAVVVPAVGESISEGTIAEWHIENDGFVKRDDILLSLETDKATVEIPSEAEGRLEIVSQNGDTVAIGATIAFIHKAAAPENAKTSSNQAEVPVQAPASAPMQAKPAENLSPAVRRIVSENNLDSASISGHGKDGRITKADAMQAAQKPVRSNNESLQKTAPTPIDQEKTDQSETRVKMTTIRKRIAERLVMAQHTAAILTTFNEIDMTRIIALRSKYKESFKEKYGQNLGMMGLFSKACVHALKEIPDVNASIEGEEVVYKNYYNLGIAVGSPRGLVVPVIRNVENLTVAQTELAIRDYAKKARDGKLSIQDLSGGTFTITNGGVYGSLMSTPILNPPQSGILGMHKVEDRPIAVDGKIEIRPMMYVALSYDHRIIDGQGAVTFLVKVKECIEDPERLLLEV